MVSGVSASWRFQPLESSVTVLPLIATVFCTTPSQRHTNHDVSRYVAVAHLLGGVVLHRAKEQERDDGQCHAEEKRSVERIEARMS